MSKTPGNSSGSAPAPAPAPGKVPLLVAQGAGGTVTDGELSSAVSTLKSAPKPWHTRLVLPVQTVQASVTSLPCHRCRLWGLAAWQLWQDAKCSRGQPAGADATAAPSDGGGGLPLVTAGAAASEGGTAPADGATSGASTAHPPPWWSAIAPTMRAAPLPANTGDHNAPPATGGGDGCDGGDQAGTGVDNGASGDAGADAGGGGGVDAPSTGDHGKRRRKRRRRRKGRGGSYLVFGGAMRGGVDWFPLLRPAVVPPDVGGVEMAAIVAMTPRGHAPVQAGVPDAVLQFKAGEGEASGGLDGGVLDAVVANLRALVHAREHGGGKHGKGGDAPQDSCPRCGVVSNPDKLAVMQRSIDKWRNARSVRLLNDEELASVVRQCDALQQKRVQFEEMEKAREAREDAGEAEGSDEEDEAESQRTALFNSILEESTVLFCCACELCQKVLQRLQAAWQEEWQGIEHLAGLPGGNAAHLEREWECLNYWCECEAAETTNEDAIRANLQDLAKDRDAAIAEGRTETADRFEDAYWDLDWHLYELQWERIDWRFKVLDELTAMLAKLLRKEMWFADYSVVGELGLKVEYDGQLHPLRVCVPEDVRAGGMPGPQQATTAATSALAIADKPAAGGSNADSAGAGAGAGGAGAGAGVAGAMSTIAAVTGGDEAGSGDGGGALPDDPGCAFPGIRTATSDVESLLRTRVLQGAGVGWAALREGVAKVVCEAAVAVYRADLSEATRTALLAEFDEADKKQQEAKTKSKKAKKKKAKKAAKLKASVATGANTTASAATAMPSAVSPVRAPGGERSTTASNNDVGAVHASAAAAAAAPVVATQDGGTQRARGNSLSTSPLSTPRGAPSAAAVAGGGGADPSSSSTARQQARGHKTRGATTTTSTGGGNTTARALAEREHARHTRPGDAAAAGATGAGVAPRSKAQARARAKAKARASASATTTAPPRQAVPRKVSVESAATKGSGSSSSLASGGATVKPPSKSPIKVDGPGHGQSGAKHHAKGGAHPSARGKAAAAAAGSAARAGPSARRDRSVAAATAAAAAGATAAAPSASRASRLQHAAATTATAPMRRGRTATSHPSQARTPPRRGQTTLPLSRTPLKVGRSTAAAPARGAKAGSARHPAPAAKPTTTTSMGRHPQQQPKQHQQHQQHQHQQHQQQQGAPQSRSGFLTARTRAGRATGRGVRVVATRAPTASAAAAAAAAATGSATVPSSMPASHPRAARGKAASHAASRGPNAVSTVAPPRAHATPLKRSPVKPTGDGGLARATTTNRRPAAVVKAVKRSATPATTASAAPAAAAAAAASLATHPRARSGPTVRRQGQAPSFQHPAPSQAQSQPQRQSQAQPQAQPRRRVPTSAAAAAAAAASSASRVPGSSVRSRTTTHAGIGAASATAAGTTSPAARVPVSLSSAAPTTATPPPHAAPSSRRTEVDGLAPLRMPAPWAGQGDSPAAAPAGPGVLRRSPAAPTQASQAAAAARAAAARRAGEPEARRVDGYTALWGAAGTSSTSGGGGGSLGDLDDLASSALRNASSVAAAASRGAGLPGASPKTEALQGSGAIGGVAASSLPPGRLLGASRLGGTRLSPASAIGRHRDTFNAAPSRRPSQAPDFHTGPVSLAGLGAETWPQDARSAAAAVDGVAGGDGWLSRSSGRRSDGSGVDAAAAAPFATPAAPAVPGSGFTLQDMAAEHLLPTSLPLSGGDASGAPGHGRGHGRGLSTAPSSGGRDVGTAVQTPLFPATAGATFGVAMSPMRPPMQHGAAQPAPPPGVPAPGMDMGMGMGMGMGMAYPPHAAQQPGPPNGGYPRPTGPPRVHMSMQPFQGHPPPGGYSAAAGGVAPPPGMGVDGAPGMVMGGPVDPRAYGAGSGGRGAGMPMYGAMRVPSHPHHLMPPGQHFAVPHPHQQQQPQQRQQQQQPQQQRGPQPTPYGYFGPR